MSAIVLVLGTDHRFQSRSSEFSEKKHEAFAEFIRHAVAKHEVQAIAEENNKQALAEVGVDQSVPELLANEIKLAHRYCDPDRDTRRQLGILQENEIRISAFPQILAEVEVQKRLDASHQAREWFWLRQLQELAVWPTLFICGATHVPHFIRLLENNGIQVVLLADDWDA